MTHHNANKPAFPHAWEEEYGDHGNRTQYHESGMTLRQYYAGLAMQGFIASLTEEEWPNFGEPAHVAKTSVAMADALIAALDSTP